MGHAILKEGNIDKGGGNLSDDSSDEEKKAGRVYHRNIREGESNPQTALARALADLKGVEVTDLKQLYACIDHLVEQLFQSPPPADANAELTFSYEGYRITVFQDGHTVFQPLE